MLYEMIAVTKPSNVQTVKDLARTAGALILAQGGVVRGFTNWGLMLLPKPVTRNAKRCDSGHYWIMRFDASASAQALVKKTIAVDPRSIRVGMVKMGEKLKDIHDVEGKVWWNRNQRTIAEARASRERPTGQEDDWLL